MKIEKSTKIRNFLTSKIFISIMKFIASQNLPSSELQIYSVPSQANGFFKFHISQSILKKKSTPPQKRRFLGGRAIWVGFVRPFLETSCILSFVKNSTVVSRVKTDGSQTQISMSTPQSDFGLGYRYSFLLHLDEE